MGRIVNLAEVPATAIACLGAGPGAEHPYGQWVAG